MTLDSLNIRKCSLPELQDIFRAIRFIRLKIESSKKQIMKDYEQVKKNMLLKSRKHLAHDLIIRPRYEFREEEKREYILETIEGEESLFFNLDSLIIDLKRNIEFVMKFIAMSRKIKLKKFSLENIIDQLSSKYIGEKCEFIKFLTIHYPKYIIFLSSELVWLKQLNAKRTILIHEGILNRTDKYSVRFYWTANSDEKTEPQIEAPEIAIFSHSVSSWVVFQIQKLDLFLKESYKIMDEFLDFQSTFDKKNKGIKFERQNQL